MRTGTKSLAALTASVLSLGIVNSLNAQPLCSSDREQMAEKYLRMHTQVMVFSLKCRSLPEFRSALSQYSGFTNTMSETIKYWEDTAIYFFRSQGSSAPVLDFHSYRTKLANMISSQDAGLPLGDYCRKHQDFFKKAISGSPTDVDALVKTSSIPAGQVVLCQGAAPAVVAAGKPLLDVPYQGGFTYGQRNGVMVTTFTDTPEGLVGTYSYRFGDTGENLGALSLQATATDGAMEFRFQDNTGGGKASFRFTPDRRSFSGEWIQPFGKGLWAGEVAESVPVPALAAPPSGAPAAISPAAPAGDSTKAAPASDTKAAIAPTTTSAAAAKAAAPTPSAGDKTSAATPAPAPVKAAASNATAPAKESVKDLPQIANAAKETKPPATAP